MLNLVLFGPPGAGKGTQSEMLIEKYNLVHLSTGDILRKEIAEGTELGMEAKKLMDAGLLVPDSVVIGMIGSKLDQNRDARGFIFDGFPRTTAQAEALDKLLAEKNTAITLMVALEVNDEELTRRLLLRGSISGRPDDMNEDIINNRIEEYNRKTAPLKDYYTAQNKFAAVYGIGDIDLIFQKLCRAIDAKEQVVNAAQLRTEKPAAKPVAEKTEKRVESPVAPQAVARETSPVKEAPKKRAEVKKTDRPAMKKAAKAPAKKTAAKKTVKKVAAKKTAAKKKVAKKVVKKVAAKKTVKKAAKKTPKKVTRKAVKKVTRKIAKKKVAKKVAKKISKKVIKKVAKKQPRKAAAKRPAKKVVKRSVKKLAAKKRSVKKAVKRPAKKAIKRSSKKGKRK